MTDLNRTSQYLLLYFRLYLRPRLHLPCLYLLLPALATGLSHHALADSAGQFNYEALGWTPRSQLPAEQAEALPEFCTGAYVVTTPVALDTDRIEAEADQGTLTRAGEIELNGDVVFQRRDQLLKADYAHWFPEQQVANFTGNVSITSPGMTLGGDNARIDDAQGDIELNHSAWVIADRHLRGTAEQLGSPQDQVLEMKGATLTFCEPGHNDWDIAASELRLDQNEGFGTAWHTRLRVAEVPILYIPYYRFPIDDRRLTGFLDPSLSVNGMGQAEDIQIPFYLNIAPNLDATITAHHVLDHGLLWENQLRHKTALFGDGELNYGILADDEETGEERSLVNYSQTGRWGRHWSHEFLYNNVSDEDYFSDMNPSASVYRASHLPRRGLVRYDTTPVKATFLAESFQTTDEDISLSNRPYRRLPQVGLTLTPTLESGWTLKQTVQATRFNRESSAVIDGNQQTLSGRAALNGDRFLSDTRIAYPMTQPYGFFTPALDYRYRSYRLYDAEPTDDDETPAFGAPRLTLDGGLFFERETSAFNTDYIQTLEPRVLYAYSPYRSGQEDIPAFDTKATSVTYSSLFNGDRFTGGDRLADLNQISTGVTTRYIRDDGLEQFRAGVGQIWYFRDREVNINETESDYLERHTSSTLGEAEWNPNSDWTVFSFLEWDSHQDYFRQQRYGVRFRDEANHMLSLSNTRTESRDPDTETSYNTHQLDASAFWSLNDRWALFARQLRDLKHYETGERRPEDPVLESLAGFEYQNCCWRAQFTYRESSPRSSGEFSTEKRYGFMLSIQLKGLTTLGSGTDSLLSESIYGYSRRQYHDY